MAYVCLHWAGVFGILDVGTGSGNQEKRGQEVRTQKRPEISRSPAPSWPTDWELAAWAQLAVLNACKRGHDAAAAQLLPLVEQFEVTVDLAPRAKLAESDGARPLQDIFFGRLLRPAKRCRTFGVEEQSRKMGGNASPH